ncbi:MAG: family 78 glycoside hydrolase catalytic domain [Williamsia sp.]|nr:family 78 glycoside hydrolase catalytic domain [Williamsia sp.]
MNTWLRVSPNSSTYQKPYGLLLGLLLISLQTFSQHLRVVNLRCAGQQEPGGIEQAAPRLGWMLESDQRAVTQTAYHILVADDPAVLDRNEGNVWDSKEVGSPASIQIAYAGKPLQSVKKYYWKVQVRDNKNNVSNWSPVASWQMGLLSSTDWKGAQWIAFDKIADSNRVNLSIDGKKDTYTGNNVLPLLRTGFAVRKPVKTATLFICGLGQFELSLNGQKVGDHFLDPGWTKYDKQALYVPFDVTGQLRQGNNAMGVMLGNGFYYVPPVSSRYRKLKTAFGYPKMICRLAIEYSDGTGEDVVSGATWKTAAGPIQFSSIYGGEDYNAMLEQKDWDKPGFDDHAWKAVMIVDGPPILNAQEIAPLKVMEQFSPKKRSLLSAGAWVYDLGQNASGIPQIKVQGKRGDTIRILPAELLKADGSVNQRATGSPYYFQYILKGEGVETWQPRFSYYGYRYLQVSGGVPKGKDNPQHLPQLVEVTGMHTRNSTAGTGKFSCSNDLFNKTYTLINWAIKSNMASLFTDCPHREKLGWLEEDHLMGNSVQYNYDVAALFAKQISDMKYSQTEEGLVPEIAPEYTRFQYGGDMFRDSPEWGSSAVLLPWYVYQWYGNERVLAESYPMMERYMAYLQTKARGHILSQGLGDWYDLGPKPPGVSQLTPMGVTGTAIYYYDLTILSKIARLLNKQADQEKWTQRAMQVKQAFNDTFFHKDTKQYASGSQTANAMAVYMNLVDPRYRDAVIDNIVRDIRNRNNSLTAGDIGYRYLLKVLHEAGRSDVIYDMNSHADVPGYGYQLAQGATALTESWMALPAVSNNHFMLGHIMEWFYAGLAGISQPENSVAYKEIRINPEVVGDVTAAKAAYACPYGWIKTAWTKRKNDFELKVEIPVNTTATICLPAQPGARITEGKKTLDKREELKVVSGENNKVVIWAGSGSYTFRVESR